MLGLSIVLLQITIFILNKFELQLHIVLLFIFRYQEALVLLVSQVLKKMQFRQNRNELLNLDDDTPDDDVSYLRFCACGCIGMTKGTY